jgi:ABC-2 type transport system permease protein
MTATTMAPTTMGPTDTTPPSGVTLARVIRSEWIKLRSLRSTLFALMAAVVLTVGLGVLISALRANDFNQHGFGPGPHFDSALVSLRGIYLAQLPIGVLGVLMITGDYAVLWAKAMVFTVTAFVVGGIASLAAFLGGQAMLSSAGVNVALGSPGAARAVLGGALYLTVVGLLGVGLGFLLRNTAGAIATLFGLLLVLPAIAAALPASLYNDVFRYLPMVAGTQAMTTIQDSTLLTPWQGIGVFFLYAVAAIGAGALVFRHHDA